MVDHLTEVYIKLGLDLTQVASCNKTLLETSQLGLHLTQVASNSNSNSNLSHRCDQYRSRNNSRNSYLGPDLTRVDLEL